MPLFGALAEKMPGCSIINPDKMREIRHPYWDVRCDKGKGENLVFSPKVKIKEGAKWTADWYRIHKLAMTERLIYLKSFPDFTIAKDLQRAGMVSFLQGDRKCPGPRSHNEREEADHGRLEHYLGLTNHPKVKEAAIEALRSMVPGCAGSRFLNGTSTSMYSWKRNSRSS